MDRAVMPATQHGEIRQGGGAAVGPVLDVMPLAERQAAPRKATAVIAMLKYPL